ncbi:crotonase/enoyl-CoA hydratase family protein [Mycolicibacterium hodleri]|uniref:Enoyl-CoA hydratase n=1 Tax=Mycolicibacterium hodleri TaxID=49897 RepID=A0A502E7Y9_9MYCO|nr:crotonase/enoyl-CoA hydratase family protein [Mycolicibacterium hodleri]TPG32561.1 enoyl-CoA hydratase [Mycolicibacterium hodleri]
MSGTVCVEVDDFVAVITIDRPAVRNAIDLETACSIAAALDEADERSDVRSIVLTGSGETFCAGMDLKAFAASGQRPITESRGAFGIVERPPDKPLIGAVEGKALGGGFEIALACDVIVAARTAAFGLPEVKRGLVAAAGGVLFLPQRIPFNIGMEMILTGEPITAARAADLGLVNKVVDTGEATTAAITLARSIGRNAPLAVQTAKRLARAARDWRDVEAFDLQRPHTAVIRESRDAMEGARAFVEKRPPQWVGA